MAPIKMIIFKQQSLNNVTAGNSKNKKQPNFQHI